MTHKPFTLQFDVHCNVKSLCRYKANHTIYDPVSHGPVCPEKGELITVKPLNLASLLFIEICQCTLHCQIKRSPSLIAMFTNTTG